MNDFTRLRRAMAVSAMLAPPVFVTLATIANLLTPGYNPIVQTISRLAESGQPYGWLLNLSFVAYAFLVQPLGPLLFAASPNRSGVLLWLLVLVYGMGGVFAAIYPVGDFRPVLGALTVDNLHDVAARTTFLAILTLSFVTPYVLRHLPGWEGWRRYSVIMGVLTAIFILPFAMNWLPELRGVLQRGFFLTTMLWIFGLGLRMYRAAKLHESAVR